MRVPLIASLFIALAFAGCIADEDIATDSVEAQFEAEAATDFHDDSFSEKPAKRWEPKYIFETETPIIEPGAEIEFYFDVTDLDDYEYPTDFLDWQVDYQFSPDPVSEGDATMLPSTYNTTLYKVAFHNFTFNVADGQGVDETVQVTVQVGDPCAENPEQWGCDGAPVDTGPVGDPIDTTIAVTASCGVHCTELGAVACQGLPNLGNGQGCAWIEVGPEAAGKAFTISGSAGALFSDADAVALSSCSPTADELRSYGNEGDESGTIPEGAGCLVAWLWADAAGDITFHVDAHASVLEDRGWYTFDPTTGLCHVKSYTQVGSVYVSGLGGGTWVLAETNMVAGLQVGGGVWETFASGAEADCVDGDAVLV